MIKKKRMKKLTFTFAILVVVFVAVDLGCSFYMIDYALSNKDRDTTYRAGYEQTLKRYPELRPWLDSLQKECSLRDTFIITKDGERQHALYAKSSLSAGRTALLVHGYHDRLTSMLHIARIYNKVLHYNILLPDLHGHGQSDGDDVQMGWKDRLDVLNWANVANNIFTQMGDTIRMLIHGISMGAATTMCVSGEPTPSFIKCFVEDCGYTNVWDEFAYELKQQFGLSEFPILYTTSLLCDMKYGWNFREASPLEQVKKCKKPMLFIHGDNDDFVPTWMVYPLYEAKPQPKELWIAKGSKHALSYNDHKEEYTSQVVIFVSKWMK